ncbi:MAG TPA: hypothetical protein VNY52_03115 [Solirubrobacteraceae bacterium]|nr:hypothetical protein [Solirubrobacteraceae bacterium]
MFAASLAASSTAAAAEVLPSFISEKVELEEEHAGVGKLKEFFFEVKNLNFGVGCFGVDNKVEIGAEMHSKLTIEFTECFVYNLFHEVQNQCKVKEPIVIKLRDQLVYKNHKEGEEIFDIFYPDEEVGKSKFHAGVMTTVTIEGALCTIKGKYEIKGSAIAVPSPNTPGKEERVVKINFNGKEAPTGTYENEERKELEEAGKMVLNGETVYLKGDIEQELKTGAKWGAE